MELWVPTYNWFLCPPQESVQMLNFCSFKNNRVNDFARIPVGRYLFLVWMFPKWMVKIMEHLIKMDDLRVYHGIPLFLETWDGINYLGCMNPCKYWNKLPINWCRISSINSTYTVSFCLVSLTSPSVGTQHRKTTR